MKNNDRSKENIALHYFRTGFLSILGITCFLALMNVAGLFGQHILDSLSYVNPASMVNAIINSLYGAAFVTFIPIFAHIAIVGNKAPVEDYELNSKSTLLNFGLFWFVVTFLITFSIHSDFLVSYYSLTTGLLAIWTFFVIANIIAELHKNKEEFERLYEDQCCTDEDE